MGAASSTTTGATLTTYEGNPHGAIVDKAKLIEALAKLDGDGASLAVACAPPGVTLTRAEMVAEFTPMAAVADEAAWTGTLVDCFSPNYDTSERKPWEKNAWSRRFVENIGDELCISGDYGDKQWGRRFDATTDAYPTLTTPDPKSATRTTSFLCQVPPDAPARADAENGALEFVVTLGTIRGTKALRWSTTYKGAGGKFGEQTFPPDDGENIWVYVA